MDEESVNINQMFTMTICDIVIFMLSFQAAPFLTRRLNTDYYCIYNNLLCSLKYLVMFPFR